MMFVPTLISRIFEPVFILPLFILVTAWLEPLSQSAKINFTLVLIFGILLPPVLFLILALKSHKISNWDISNRKERPIILILLLVLTLIDLFIINLFHNQYLTHLVIIFLVWSIGFLIITTRFKISGHTGVLTLIVGLILNKYGHDWWWLVLTIPLLGWARVKRKNHTLAEVITGVVYSMIVVLILG
jgi:hypothetical protein